MTDYEFSAQDYAIIDEDTSNHDTIATVHITGDDKYDKVVPPKWRDLFVAAPDMLSELEQVRDFINELLDTSPDGAHDHLVNNGEKVVEGLNGVIEKAKGIK